MPEIGAVVHAIFGSERRLNRTHTREVTRSTDLTRAASVGGPSVFGRKRDECENVFEIWAGLEDGGYK